MTSDFVRGMSQEIYNIIYETFPDRNQANGVVSIFEKTLTQLEVNNKVEFNERLDLIISKVKEKLGEEFATKADLFATKVELEAGLTKLELRIAQSELKLVNLIQAENEKLTNKIEQVEEKLTNKIEEVKTELKEDIKELRAEFKNDIGELRIEFKNDIKEVKDELKEVKDELKNDIKEVMTKNLDDKIKSFKYSVIVWIIGGIGIGVINILLTYFKH